ncbi:hypothetical protein AAG906_004436 [Vitis piasezkii]
MPISVWHFETYVSTAQTELKADPQVRWWIRWLMEGWTTVFRKFIMARTQQKKSLWTPEEDDKLKEFRHKYPNLSWPAIAKQAKLNRTGKSCWERWENNLNPDINKDEFSREEDDIIIQQMSLPQNRHATISDLRRHLLYLEEHLMDDEASDHSVRGGDLEALMAEFASLIPNVDPNETSDHSVRGDDLEALMAEFASLIPNVDPSAISSIPEYTS